MTALSDSIIKDIENIKKISIVPTMLEVVCRVTGMGFSAIARVTDDHWIACSVRDEISFGLKEGGELALETTICNEIRQSRQGVVIDHVSNDPQFCNHHTPKMYGFESYISLPIVLNTGEFFGTLCAIDPKPRILSDIKTTGMFSLFAELIAFHLQAIKVVEDSVQQYERTAERLILAEEENQKFEHITYHSLREPVRKISLFSDLLLNASVSEPGLEVRSAATDIKRLSLQLAGMLRKLEVDQ